MAAASGSKRRSSLETMLSEQAIMTLAVSWESFLHDVLISYMEHRPKPCLKDHADRIRRSLGERFPGASRWVSVTFPDSPTQAQLERLIDPKGRNISATSASTLRDLANRLLAAPYARKFSLNADDSAFIDYLVAVRNFLGHRSNGARERVREAIRALGTNAANAELTGQTRRLGVYLKQPTASGTRVNSIGARVLAIASVVAA
jgi:hypothetical protein